MKRLLSLEAGLSNKITTNEVKSVHLPTKESIHNDKQIVNSILTYDIFVDYNKHR